MSFGIISSLLFFIGILMLLNKNKAFQIEGISTSILRLTFLLKLFAGISLWFIYSYYYTDRVNSDIFKFYDDAVYLFNSSKNDFSLFFQLFTNQNLNEYAAQTLAETNFWYSSDDNFWLNDNRTMIRIHWLLLYLSNGFYGFHLLFFSFISFVGSVGVFKFIRKLSNIPTSVLFAICFIAPSLIFWTSAPLKESFLFFNLGLLLWSYSSITTSFKFKHLFFFLLGLCGMLSLKIYLLMAVLPALIVLGNCKEITLKKLSIRFGIVHLILLLFVLFQSTLITELLSTKLTAFKQLAEQTNANSYIHINNYNSLLELLSTLPRAFYNLIIHPILPPKWGLFNIISSAEHLVYLAFLILAIIYFLKPKKHSILFFCLSFVVISYAIIGLTTPVIGAIVRYKAPVLPFYLTAIATFVNFQKISPKIK